MSTAGAGTGRTRGTAEADSLTPPVPAEARSGSIGRTVLLLAGVLLLLAVVRQVTNADELTSAETYGAALRLAIPILLAGLGALWAERAGVVNIGLEGMMILGTWFGAWAGLQWGPWGGVVAGTIGGALGGLVHAVATVTFGVDQVVSGVAINIIAAGVARFLSALFFQGHGGGITQSAQVTGTIPHVTVPILAGGSLFGWKSPDIFGWMQNRDLFLVSDVGGLLKGFTSDLSLLTVVALALIPLTYFLLWRTGFGLRLRSVGEHPMAAESLGVRVYTMKYVGVTISGALAGLGGAFLVLVAGAGIYRETQTGGRGFIGLAAVIFGNYRPGGVGAAAGLFGYADALRLRSDPAVHALLLFVAIGLAVGAAWFLWRRRFTRAGLLAGFGGIVYWWYLSSDTIPREIISITPAITTLLVLALAAQRLRPPAADGRPYRRGQQLE
jgi:general nucleoside transport system permease protein